MNEIEKLNLESADLVAERIAQLKALFPEAFAEGGIDFAKLRLLLGDEVDESTEERYGFTWPGKRDAIRQSQTPSRATLRPAPEESVDWDSTQNLYIEGDNLEVLKLLQRSYHGRVKLIYIDPPYNTGNDFVYKDKFGDTIENYRKQAGLAGQSNADTSGRYHSDWCSMIYPRLKLARELLSDGGVIFISIDDSEYRNLKNISDEIFGSDCFIATIVRNTNSSKNQSLFVSVSHEYCLVYAKSIEYLKVKHAENKWSVPKNNVDEYVRKAQQLRNMGITSEEITAELKTLTNYPRFLDFTNYWYFDERGLYRKGDLGGVPNGNNEPLFNPLTGRDDPVPPGGFRFGSEKLQNLVEEGRIHFHTDGSLPTIKRYLTENIGQRPKSIMSDDQRPDVNMLNKEFKTPFDNPKQLAFLERIVGISDSDAIVMDFFSGSATTAHAVMKLNAEYSADRKFIMVQLPEQCEEKSAAKRAGFETICEIGKERIRRAGAKIAAEMAQTGSQLELGADAPRKLDIGFRVFKLDESGISRPQEGDLIADVRKPGRSDEDIIFEMMLKWGLELTLPVKKVEAAGYPCWSVAEGELVCCLASGLTMQAIDAIADMAPRRVLLLDGILDDTLKLNAVQAFKRVEEKTGREVELRTV